MCGRPGLFIAHGQIVLDGWTTLGHNVQVNPFVTLGVTNSARRGFDLRGPTIGDHVSIGTGAKILGPVVVGEYVKVGANAVVVSGIPARHTAVGAPARAFPGATGGRRAGLELDQTGTAAGQCAIGQCRTSLHAK